jgi:hypothetical protein
MSLCIVIWRLLKYISCDLTKSEPLRCSGSSWTEKAALILMFYAERDIENRHNECRFFCPEWS